MKLSKPKYIFVTGGVASSLGKGIISASIARLLQARGYSVTIQKLDPYINVDPGTLNPYEHGECYVTEDGAETDLDLGHYERFTNQPTSKANNVTTGKIYKSVIEKERKGEYLGKTVQVIPHITDEIKRRIQMLAQKKVYDVIITEIGGTVGDIESLPFIESVRQLRYSLGYKSTALVHLTLIPYMAASGELKTKPTQHSVKALLENMGSGAAGMFETSMVAILVSAICALIREYGGFEALLGWIKKAFRGKRGGQIGMGLLVGAMDIATANNTVAIVMANPIAKEMSEEYGITPRKAASLLDTFSCIFQGIIPYGAQMLVAISAAHELGYAISAFDIIPNLFYPYLLAVSSFFFIAIDSKKKA